MPLCLIPNNNTVIHKLYVATDGLEVLLSIAIIYSDHCHGLVNRSPQLLAKRSKNEFSYLNYI
jgi:hypothetical protein